jgi:hypothetical protein
MSQLREVISPTEPVVWIFQPAMRREPVERMILLGPRLGLVSEANIGYTERGVGTVKPLRRKGAQRVQET